MPHAKNCIGKILGRRISILEGVNNGLHFLWVVNAGNVLFIVPDEVVVELDSARLLFVNDNISNVKEESINLGVISPELGSAIDGTCGLVCLKNYEELANEFLAFFPKSLAVEMNEEIIGLYLELY